MRTRFVEVSLAQFQEQLVASELLSAVDVQVWFDDLPATSRPKNGFENSDDIEIVRSNWVDPTEFPVSETAV